MRSFDNRPRPRHQARRRRSAAQNAALALGLVLAALIGYAVAIAFLVPGAAPASSATPTPAVSASAVAQVSPSPSATAVGSVSPSTTPSAAPVTPAPTRTPSPVTPVPAPTGTRGPAPTGTPERSAYVTSGPRSSDRVALTFDFGGRVGDASAIVDYLVAHGVKATIFITGKTLDDAAGPQVLERVCGRPGQFDLGNHSYDHSDFDGLTPDAMRTQLSKTEAAFAAHCARSPRPFFRPPDGAMGGYKTATYYRILDTVGAAGYSRTVAWDVDTLDWSEATTAANILDYVRNGRAGAPGARGGSIVLMHLGGYHTLEALPAVIAHLQADGYALVTLRELLGV